MKLFISSLALIGFTASAIADTTLYGKLHTSVDVTNTGGTDAGTETHVSSNSSRIGIKGKEKISDDMNAVYGLEWGVDVAESNGAGLTDRNQYVGLEGKSWGNVKVGYMDTPNKTIGRKVELFGDQLGDARTLTSTFDGDTTSDRRAQDAIMYTSPDLNGFKVQAALINEDDGDQGYSANAMFEKNGIFVGVGHTNIDTGKAINASGTTTTSTQTSRIAAAYDTGKVKVTGMYQKDNDIDGVADADRNVYGVGASLKTSAGNIKGQYYVADDVGNRADSGANLAAIGYDHNLSKRTTVYAQYVELDNDKSATYSINGGHGDTVSVDLTGTESSDPSGVSMGLIHKF